MKKLFTSLLLIALMRISLEAQINQVSKIGYEYTSISQKCIVKDFGQTVPILQENQLVQCYTGIPDFSNLGKDGWELVTTISGYSTENTVTIGTAHWLIIYTQTFIFKRTKPINIQPITDQLNSIIQLKIDSSLNILKRFIVSSLNQSHQEPISSESTHAIKDLLTTQIRAEVKSTIDSLLYVTQK